MPNDLLAILISDIKKYSSNKSDRIYRLIDGALNVFINTHIKNERHVTYRKKTGDGLIICFTNCLVAANVALKMRDYFLSLNWKEEDCFESIIPRIALHFGTITTNLDDEEKIEDICGNTVICAARIEPVTAPGAVYCSKPFLDTISQMQTNNTHAIPLGKIALAKDFGELELYRIHWEHELLP